MNTKYIRFVFLLAAACFLATSIWAKTFALTASHLVPAAAGSVDAHVDKNGNTAVDIKVRDLAHPSSLTPPANTYVVWFQQAGADPQSQGELKVNGKLSGELRTVTQWKAFDVFITAESDPAVKSPSGDQVMNANIQE